MATFTGSYAGVCVGGGGGGGAFASLVGHYSKSCSISPEIELTYLILVSISDIC